MRGLLALLALVALAVAGLAWLTSTQTGLHFSVALAQRVLGGRLSIDDARGSLDGTLRVARIAYVAHGSTIELSGIEITSNLAALYKRRLLVERLDVARVVVRQEPAQPQPAASPTLPDSLALPIELRVDTALIHLLEIVRPDATTQVRNLYASYTGGHAGHVLRSLRAETDFGAVGAAGTIAADAPFAIDLGVAYVRAGAPARDNKPPEKPADLPVAIRAQLAGTLRETEATAFGTVGAVRATVFAVVTPFDRPWPALLRALRVDAGNVDLSRFLAGLPHTDLVLQARARGSAKELEGDVNVHNVATGPIDRERIPVSSVAFRFATDLATARLEQLAVDFAPGGTLRGGGTLQREPLTAKLDIQARAIDLRALRSDLQATALSGPLSLGVDGPRRQTVHAELAQPDLRVSASATRDGNDVDFHGVQLAARGGTATGQGKVRLGTPLRFDTTLEFKRFDPARFGAFPAGLINGNAHARGALGTPRNIDADWRIAQSRLRGQPLTSRGTVRVAGERVTRVDAVAQLGTNTIDVQGAFGGTNDRLRWRLDAPALAQLAEGIGGQINASGSVSGTGPRMVVEVNGSANQLRLPADIRIATLRLQARAGLQPDAPVDIALKAQRVATPQLVVDTVSLDTKGTRSQHEANLRADTAQRSLALTVRGGWSGALPGSWAGELAAAQIRTDAPVRAQVALAAPAPISVAVDRVAVSALHLVVTGAAPEAHVRLEDLTWQPGHLSTSGSFEHLSTRWIETITTLPTGMETTVSLGGQWSVRAAPRLDGTVTITREGGDVRLAGPPAIEAGLTDVSLRTRFDNGNATAELSIDGKLATIRAQGRLATAQGAPGFGFTPESAVSFEARLDVAELRLITEPLQTFARVSGRLNANLQGGGTLGAPRADGTLAGDALAIDVPPYGVQLDQGRLRVDLHGDQVQVRELALRGGDGRFSADGNLSLRAGTPADLRWRADNFRLLNRPDMRLVVSGAGSAGVVDGRFGLRGDLRAERGHFEMAYKQLAKPGEDVDVVGETPPPEPRAARAPVNLDLRVDLGKKLTVRAAGFDGKATGTLHLTTTAEGQLHAAGRVEAADAKFRAYGQQLVVDPGVLVFDGPIDNPTLQITAWRRNQQVEAGVQLSGTAKTPQVTLVSNPEVAQGDRLSWLVLGHGPGTATGADLGLLQGAAGAFLGGGSDSVPLTQKVANSLGLDELAVRSSSEIESNVVAVGKRLSDKLLVTYEHGLGTAAENLVRLDYALSRRVSLRAETGTSTGVGVFYRFAWD